MSKVKIYGSPRSRASRVLWCAKELGLEYELCNSNEMKREDYLAINPNGKVPALVDGEVKLFESLAITMYLAKKFGTGELYPRGLEQEALVWQWTLWGIGEVEPSIMPAFALAMGRSTDVEAAKAGEARLRPLLTVLNNALGHRDWLIEGRFSIADINTSSSVSLANWAKIDISYAPAVVGWLQRCQERQA